MARKRKLLVHVRTLRFCSCCSCASSFPACCTPSTHAAVPTSNEGARWALTAAQWLLRFPFASWVERASELELAQPPAGVPSNLRRKISHRGHEISAQLGGLGCVLRAQMPSCLRRCLRFTISVPPRRRTCAISASRSTTPKRARCLPRPPPLSQRGSVPPWVSFAYRSTNRSALHPETPHKSPHK